MRPNPFLVLVVFAMLLSGCDETQGQPVSTSGVKKLSVQVQTDSTGATVEQNNIKNRLMSDNSPGAIKHLYVISAYSGQTLIYSTVKGKVTSSGKRLTPNTVAASDGQYVSSELRGCAVNIGGDIRRTTEVLQDDGSYGSSVEYLYWWDTKGIFHQHYVSGGQILHVSSEPLAIKSVIINMEHSGSGAIEK